MSTNTINPRSVFVCLLVSIVISCGSGPSAKELTLAPDVEKPSPSPNSILDPTPDSLVEEPMGQPQPTSQILGEPAIAPTVDINIMNINLKKELYFDWGAEQGDGLPPCTSWLFNKYDVSFDSEYEFIVNGTTPFELKGVRVSPFFLATAYDKIHVCIYGFPEDEMVTVELYTPEGDLCTSQDVRVSDYYYLTVGDITGVDFTMDWPRCSHAGQWSLVVKSASVSVTEPIEITWYQLAKFSVFDSCAPSDHYISVEGVGYPPGESRFLGVYSACSDPGEGPGGNIVCKLLKVYMISIDDSGRFQISLSSDLSYLGAQYIVVPVMADNPPDFGGTDGFGQSPETVYYRSTCSYTRDLYLTDPSLIGEDVEEVQQRLRSLGYFEVGPVDGIFGSKTESAVFLFQQMNELDVNGIVNEATRNTLSGEDAISRPHERNLYVVTPRLDGADVIAVQQRLVDLGYVEVGEVDGYYGPKTESAVLRFQKMNGLSEGGMVDEQTWNVIFSKAAVPGW